MTRAHFALEIEQSGDYFKIVDKFLKVSSVPQMNHASSANSSCCPTMQGALTWRTPWDGAASGTLSYPFSPRSPEVAIHPRRKGLISILTNK
ncbi:hypothetical protein K443DRAFT_677832 [Laccaria amethystina LaAM-08-1]|uniref:Uncharacterized protein n=1 Tax=Laccaria amethystina LaAM-08-1 TaxID=1095629 RepID=A0A0C9WT82_9AGAR|nr:hypothetical protein K443DRAFT_677832 [Laccaria amethystina LaAM-08-1]